MDYAVIMAGGSGKRLWPLSRQKRPKQVLKLLDGETLLWKCFKRLEGIFDLRNILVLTNAEYVDMVRESLSELPEENVIAEPAIRDTAGAIGLAATILHKYDKNANMAVVTADQVLDPADVFQQAMKTALTFVNENHQAMVTFGIQPKFPSTQYGYIRFGKAQPGIESMNAVHVIDGFKEKPDERTAARYIQDGQYYWNSGMFVWRCETILEKLRHYLPECLEPLSMIGNDWGRPEQNQTLWEWFPKLPKISIDYAVMEKAENIFGISLDCAWLDLGSFTALEDIMVSDENHNIIAAQTSELLDSHQNIVVTEDDDHMIAMIGVDNMIVAHSKDATLICPKDQSHRLKEFLEQIKNHKSGKYL